MQRTIEFPPGNACDQAARLSRQEAKILQRLKQGPATNRDLTQICLRYGARIFDLNRKGYRIVSERVEGSLWKFTLQ